MALFGVIGTVAVVVAAPWRKPESRYTTANFFFGELLATSDHMRAA